MTRGRKKKTILEICSNRQNEWFINFTPHQSFGESLGPFNSLDECLRYVYTILDSPQYSVEVAEVNNEGVIFFIPDFEIDYKPKKDKQNNVTPIERGKK